MTAGWVSDEVWAQMDPRAGRLTRRGRWALAGTVSLIVLVGAMIFTIGRAGVFAPRIGAWASEFTFDVRAHTAVERLQVGNNDWLTEHVVAVTTRSRGVTIVSATRPTIAAGHDGTLVVRLHFDCATVGPGDLTFTLWLKRPWGSTSVRIWDPGAPDSAGDAAQVQAFLGGPGATACGRPG